MFPGLIVMNLDLEVALPIKNASKLKQKKVKVKTYLTFTAGVLDLCLI